MLEMRGIVHDARTDLSAALSKRFDDKVSLEALQEDLETRRWSDSGIDPINPNDANRIINALFDGKGLIDDDNGPDPIEMRCFDKCIELLRNAHAKMAGGAENTVIGGERQKQASEGGESRCSVKRKRRSK